MNKITLESGTYAVDDILQGFDIIEKPSSNVAFVATCLITHQMYVQFKNGSGYIYSEVDYDTLSIIPVAESIGKFISSQVVKKFPSEKMEKALIIPVPSDYVPEEPILLITGDVSRFGNYENGKVIVVDSEATVDYIQPVFDEALDFHPSNDPDYVDETETTDQEPEF